MSRMGEEGVAPSPQPSPRGRGGLDSHFRGNDGWGAGPTPGPFTGREGEAARRRPQSGLIEGHRMALDSGFRRNDGVWGQIVG